MTGKEKVFAWIKGEAVLCIAAVCALASMIFVPPTAEYIGYIDVRVLCLLFCLMTVVLGFQACGLFDVLAQKMLEGERRNRAVYLMLVMLPFFVSMLVTNDVALITFVPFTVLVLELVRRRNMLIRIVVLQTIAANLGSMATPVGNPQNLFLYANYELSAGQFFGLLVPPTIVSLVVLALASVLVKGETIHVTFLEKTKLRETKKLAVYAVLFGLCLLSVFKVLHYGLLTIIVTLAFFVLDRPLLKKVDYSLLLTFICFFIFSGNLGEMPAVQEVLGGLLQKNTLLTSIMASQVISNVPAAVLLSGFTDQWKELLLGVDVGGLGTPIASLASLISLKLYLKTEGAQPLKYMIVFTIANIIGLAVLIPLSMILVA